MGHGFLKTKMDIFESPLKNALNDKTNVNNCKNFCNGFFYHVVKFFFTWNAVIVELELISQLQWSPSICKFCLNIKFICNPLTKELSLRCF